MKSIAQATARQAVTATTDASRTGRDGTFHGSSPMPPAVADHGKIRLGGELHGH